MILVPADFLDRTVVVPALPGNFGPRLLLIDLEVEVVTRGAENRIVVARRIPEVDGNEVLNNCEAFLSNLSKEVVYARRDLGRAAQIITVLCVDE